MREPHNRRIIVLAVDERWQLRFYTPEKTFTCFISSITGPVTGMAAISTAMTSFWDWPTAGEYYLDNSILGAVRSRSMINNVDGSTKIL